MFTMFVRSLSLLAVSIVLIAAPLAHAADPPGRDSVLDWNAILLQANADDHTFGSPEQGGPTRTSRAMAIVHAAIFDAVNSIEPMAEPYLVQKPGKGASIDAAP